MESIFFNIGIVFIVASILALIARLLKQPIIPAYIIAGLIIGPTGLGWITDFNTIATISEIGIAFLLFMVGLELDLKKLKDVGPVTLFGGIIQIFVLFGFGCLFAYFSNNFSLLECVYLGLILAFSSTMVVVKLLSDKMELDTLHARIIIGFLLIEDILAIMSISILTTISNFSVSFLLLSVLKALVIGAVVLFSTKFIFPGLYKFAAESKELLFVIAVSTCFMFSLFAAHIGSILIYILGPNLLGYTLTAHMLQLLSPGFSIAVGAFLAGVGLGNLPYNVAIVGKVKPLKDFFSIMFFVALGMQFVINSFFSRMITPLIVFIVFIIAVKPMITMLICSLFGYARRTSFMAGINLAQTSEFSLIIVSLGMMQKHIPSEVFTMAILLAIITISATTYFIKFDDKLYYLFSKYLHFLEKIGINRESLHFINRKKKYNVLIVGYDRIGYSIVNTLKTINKKSIIIDFNPDIIKKLMKIRMPCIYGDVEDPDILERIDFRHIEAVISTVPQKHATIYIINKVKHINPKIVVFVTANVIDEALDLYSHGADYVILPHFLGGEHVSIMLKDMACDFRKILKVKSSHIKELKSRKIIGHEHPKQTKHE